jgi:NTP pyrophosphatase (non-canonical NTP hydrolase)
MNLVEYQDRVKRTMNKSLGEKQALSMLSMGIAGESGELIDMLKKSLYHDHELNIHEVIKEVGDIMWYIANLCNELNLDLSQILDINIEKLLKRYPDGFDTKKSINREV